MKKSYTFYIAVNPSLAEIYGDEGCPVKIGYATTAIWGRRVEYLNGKIPGETKYAEVKGFKYVLQEKWRIPELCHRDFVTDRPMEIEKKIMSEIIKSGGKKIEGHFTLKNGKGIRSRELFILPEKTERIIIRSGTPQWNEDPFSFKKTMLNHADENPSIIKKVPVEDVLHELLKKVQDFTIDGK